MSRLRVAGGLTALGLFVVAFVGGWEGKRNVAYRDIVGVWTVCYGETRGVRKGDRKTDAECDAMLAEALVEFEQGMRRCLNAPDAIPAKMYAAMVSVTYNIGVGAFCKSSMRRHANDNDLRRACDSLMLYVRAGGKTVPGLVNRRDAERDICVGSL